MGEIEEGDDVFGEGLWRLSIVVDFGSKGLIEVGVHEVSFSDAIPRAWESYEFYSLTLSSCSLRTFMMLL